MGNASDLQKQIEMAENVGAGFVLMADLFKAEAAEVQTLRAALRELAGAAVTDVDPSGRPFEPGEFHEHVLRVAVEALGAFMDAEPDADGGFNGNGQHFAAALAEHFGPDGGEPESDEHSDGDTDPNYCEECDGPCDQDR